MNTNQAQSVDLPDAGADPRNETSDTLDGMRNGTPGDRVQVLVRVPRAEYDKIKRLATRNRRSVNAEVLVLLDSHPALNLDLYPGVQLYG